MVDSPQYGLIRRLELQAHLGSPGEDDLCPPADFEDGWNRVETFMAMAGVLPPEDPFYVRVDPAVDVHYERPEEGRDVLEALRYARWPYGWYAEYQGPPPHTTVAIKNRAKTVARVYCRNTKLRNGNARRGKLRFERAPAQYEQLTGFLDAERLGLNNRVYTAETARRRRKLARQLGVAASDGESEPLDASLDDLLEVPRSAWTASG